MRFLKDKFNTDRVKIFEHFISKTFSKKRNVISRMIVLAHILLQNRKNRGIWYSHTVGKIYHPFDFINKKIFEVLKNIFRVRKAENSKNFKMKLKKTLVTNSGLIIRRFMQE